MPMAPTAPENLNAAGSERPKAADSVPAQIPNTADAGYFSEQAVQGLGQLGMDPHLAVGRQKHHEAPVPSKAAAPSADASVKEKMQHKLRLATGKALYSVVADTDNQRRSRS